MDSSRLKESRRNSNSSKREREKQLEKSRMRGFSFFFSSILAGPGCYFLYQSVYMVLALRLPILKLFFDWSHLTGQTSKQTNKQSCSSNQGTGPPTPSFTRHSLDFASVVTI